MTTNREVERPGAITFRGAPMTLLGDELKPGDPAPDFSLIPASDPNGTVKLADALRDGTRAALLIVVPSIDTSVCALETVRFNREVTSIPSERLGVYTISVDLPYAQKRWSTAEKVTSIELLSDYRTRQFGISYGVLIKEIKLYARSIFLVDNSGIIRYVEIVKEVAMEPEYQKSLDAARAIIA